MEDFSIQSLVQVALYLEQIMGKIGLLYRYMT